MPLKRNKRTEKVGAQNLSPLTERILDKMGWEGAALRQRLQRFYQNRVELERPEILSRLEKEAGKN